MSGEDAGGTETGAETSSTWGAETSSTSGGETDESGDDSGVVFVPMTDALVVEMCDIWDPDACPEGEKCTAYATAGSSWDANKCVEVMGDDQPGEPCQAFGENPGVSGLDSCAKGSMCWEIDADTELGYCAEFCQGSANDPQCPEGSYCPIYGNGVLALCLPTCDPLLPETDCHNPENLCIANPGGDGFICVLDASEGDGSYGAQCLYANSCNYGLFCASADAVPGCGGAQGCCAPFCDLDAPDCPDPELGVECVPWYENEPPPGYASVGGCVIPS